MNKLINTVDMIYLCPTDDDLLRVSKAGIEKFIETMEAGLEKEKLIEAYNEIRWDMLDRLEEERWRKGKIPLGEVKE